MTKLKPDGHLTASQADEANRIGVTHMEYLPVIMKNMAEENANRIANRKHEPLQLMARKPFIVVGHGPDWNIQVEKLRGTKIPIIATDVCVNDMFEMGIIPQYIVTYEEAKKNVHESMFDFEKIRKHNIPIIGSRMTKKELEESIINNKVAFSRFINYPVQTMSNVGLFGAMFAKTELFADRIILIGMNCWGLEKYPFLNWYCDWRKFISESDDKLIVNCSEGGILYFGRIIECDFNDLQIIYGHPQ